MSPLIKKKDQEIIEKYLESWIPLNHSAVSVLMKYARLGILRCEKPRHINNSECVKFEDNYNV